MFEYGNGKSGFLECLFDDIMWNNKFDDCFLVISHAVLVIACTLVLRKFVCLSVYLFVTRFSVDSD